MPGAHAPDSIIVDEVTFKDDNSYLDFTGLDYKEGSLVDIKVLHTDFKHLKLDYRYFRLNLNLGRSTETEQMIIGMYENQKNYFGDHYKDAEGFQRIDVLYKQYKGGNTLIGFWFSQIDEWWWYYGYNKPLVIWRSFEIMFFIFLLNLLVGFSSRLYNGYTIDEFIIADQRTTDKYGNNWKRYVSKFFYCFLYTGYIFWGLKLSIEKIKLSNLGLALWIITQYVIGVVCLAYIANVVITKL